MKLNESSVENQNRVLELKKSNLISREKKIALTNIIFSSIVYLLIVKHSIFQNQPDLLWIYLSVTIATIRLVFVKLRQKHKFFQKTNRCFKFIVSINFFNGLIWGHGIGELINWQNLTESSSFLGILILAGAPAATLAVQGINARASFTFLGGIILQILWDLSKATPEPNVSIFLVCFAFYATLISWLIFDYDKRDTQLIKINLKNINAVDRLQEIINSIPASISILNAFGQYTAINEQFKKTFHLNESEIIGKNMGHYFPEDPTTKELINFVKSTDRSYNKVMSVKTPEGARWYRILCEKIKSSNLCLIMSFDIHENWLAQEELKKQSVLLEEKSKLAGLAQITAGIAHEINNPLMIISGNLENILSESENINPNNSKINTASSKALNALLQISEIVSAMKGYTRSIQKLEPNGSELMLMIKNTLIFCEEKIKHSQINLQIFCSKKLNVFISPIEFSQVLLNLINNAREAIETSSEPRWIEIHVNQLDERNCEIVVRDSGKGVSEVYLDKLMQPFFTTKEVGKGTGLGLSISQNICDKYGGTLKYRTHNSNTEFVITLPCSESIEVTSKKIAA